MSTPTPMPAFRMPSLRVILAAGAALLAVAVPSSALLGLPVALPSADQHIDTPAGSIDASASEQGADLCADLYNPALPAVPALPVPSLPVPVPMPALPAVPTVSAGADACASAGLDGVYADVGADAQGTHVGTGIEAQSPVSQQQIESTASETTSEAKGFFEGLIDSLFGWF